MIGHISLTLSVNESYAFVICVVTVTGILWRWHLNVYTALGDRPQFFNYHHRVEDANRIIHMTIDFGEVDFCLRVMDTNPRRDGNRCEARRYYPFTGDFQKSSALCIVDMGMSPGRDGGHTSHLDFDEGRTEY